MVGSRHHTSPERLAKCAFVRLMHHEQGACSWDG